MGRSALLRDDINTIIEKAIPLYFPHEVDENQDLKNIHYSDDIVWFVHELFQRGYVVPLQVHSAFDHATLCGNNDFAKAFLKFGVHHFNGSSSWNRLPGHKRGPLPYHP